MGEKKYEKIIRTMYYDQDNEHEVDSHTSKHHFEDFRDFHMPLVRSQNANLNGKGIIRGLEISGSIGGDEIIVKAGVAVDESGRIISLATEGEGDITSGEQNGEGPHPERYRITTEVPVKLSLKDYHGLTCVITIQHSEILRSDETLKKIEQVPWIRLQDMKNYKDDGNSVILGFARTDAEGKLAGLHAEYQDKHRHFISQAVEELCIMGHSYHASQGIGEDGTASKEVGVGDGVAGKISSSGSDLNIKADSIGVSDISGSESIRIDGKKGQVSLNEITPLQGNLDINTSGKNLVIKCGNDLIVKDANDRDVLKFESKTANLTLGAKDCDGDLIITDKKGTATAAIDGDKGYLMINTIGNEKGVLNIAVPNGALNINAPYFRIHGLDLVLDGRSGGNKRALVDGKDRLIINFANDYKYGVETPGDVNIGGNLRVKGKYIGGNPARYVRYVQLHAGAGGTDTQEIVLPSSTHVFAFVSTCFIDSLNNFDKDNATAIDIYKIDNKVTSSWIYGGAHLGADGTDSNVKIPCYTGTAQRILFRARAFHSDITVAGFGVVFYE